MTESGLFTDFYELTMAQGYWKKGMNENAVFDMFFRKHPFNGGFSVFAGLESLLDSLETFSFTDEDIDFLKKLNIFDQGFLDYLKCWKFKGDIYSFEEGSLIFPQEPVIRIHSSLIDALLIEGLVLNTINFQSLIATKTARIYLASHKGHIMEFGLRRAQGKDGALSASRASFIGGAESTSNALAGKKYGIPLSGTMSHSWVMSFPSEEEAFEAYAEIYPENPVFLIDTYDTLKSGIKNAIKTGKKLAEKGHNFGVRLDSGDIAYLSEEVRKELDNAGLKKAFIAVSNELTEEIIENLVQEKAPVDFFGVGTNLVTGGNESSFSGVIKMSAKFDSKEKKMISVMKFSENPAKTNNPGIKNVYRIYDKKGMACADILALEEEILEERKEYTYHHPMTDYRQFKLSGAKIENMLKKKIENGKRTEVSKNNFEGLKESRERMLKELENFDPSYKRILNPHVYKVSVTEELKKLKLSLIESRLKDSNFI